MSASRRQSGQALVETAIVMPLAVFMILGLIQLGLLQQGRSMTKYAAYKAVRAGAIHSAKMEVMENAALAVLLPVAGRLKGGGGSGQGVETYNKTTDSSSIQQAWDKMKSNTHSDGNGLKVAEVTICSPTTAIVGNSADFDDPDIMNAAAGWQNLDKGKLSVQVTFYYRLLIPFANMVIWNITRADQVSTQLLQVTRLGSDKNGQIQGIRKTNSTKTASTDGTIDQLGKSGKYFLPIRASFAMRMQSNFLDRFPLPSQNNCVLFFPKK